MAKLLIPIATNDDDDYDENLGTTVKFEEEEHFFRAVTTGKPQILTPTSVV